MDPPPFATALERSLTTNQSGMQTRLWQGREPTYARDPADAASAGYCGPEAASSLVPGEGARHRLGQEVPEARGTTPFTPAS